VSKSKSKSKSKFDDVPLENEPSRMKSVTDALLLKIKKESYSKFNKSHMNQTGSGFLETTTSPQERNRISVIKKIIMISSIKK
jgi:hypothetical protein